MSFKSFFFVLFLSLLVVGCRSSRSGTSSSQLETSTLIETRSDSTDFKEKFTRYLSGQESSLKLRVIEFYPPEAGDTAKHGPVKSITDIEQSVKDSSDSLIGEKHLTIRADTTTGKTTIESKETSTYQVEPVPWYEPFIPYIAFAILFAAIYYFRRKE